MLKHVKIHAPANSSLCLLSSHSQWLSWYCGVSDSCEHLCILKAFRSNRYQIAFPSKLPLFKRKEEASFVSMSGQLGALRVVQFQLCLMVLGFAAALTSARMCAHTDACIRTQVQALCLEAGWRGVSCWTPWSGPSGWELLSSQCLVLSAEKLL